jgi:hypothetical protein
LEVEEGDKQGFAGVISPRRVGGNGGKDVRLSSDFQMVL